MVWRDEHTPKYKKFLARVASRQETVFKGLKDWKILKHRFAYGNTTKERMKLHKMAVEAIAVIRQFDYENGHPPFDRSGRNKKLVFMVFSALFFRYRHTLKNILNLIN